MSENNFVKLGDVAHECRLTWSGGQTDIPIVGLEHLVPGEIELSSWDSNIEHTFSKKFLKGQVLLGRRRVYLKKAVVPPCDGICSGDITVIESTGGILPELLPFVIQNDRFFDYAMQGSAGSLSPRVKWEHLKNYEFSLPPLAEQKVLADKLWAAYRLKESYKKLLAATEEMVKSQFIEMFGDPMVNDKQWSEYSCISEITQIVLGSTPNSKEPSYWDGDIRWITPAEMTDQSYYIFDTVRHITDEGRKAANLTVLPEGTVLFSTRAPIGKVAIVGKEMCCNQGFKNFICSEKLNNVFLYYTLKLKKDYLCSLGTGTTFKELSKRTVESLKIAVPPIELQNQFETIYNQADKSGFDGRKSQFIEMFGNQDVNDRSWNESIVKDEFTLTMGKTPARNNPAFWQSGTNKWISISDMARYGRYTEDTQESITDIAVAESGIKIVPKGTIIMSFKLSIGRTAVTSEDIYTNEAIMAFRDVDETKFNMTFLQFLIANKNWLLNAKQAVKGQTLNKESIGNARIIVPPIGLQEQFAAIYNQADKSGSVLQHMIAC